MIEEQNYARILAHLKTDSKKILATLKEMEYNEQVRYIRATMLAMSHDIDVLCADFKASTGNQI